LLNGKKATVVYSSDVFAPGVPAGYGVDFQSNYLDWWLRFIGVTERFPYYSGTWRSPQEILDKLLAPLARDWSGFSAAASDFIAEGDRVVSFGVYSGTFKATGRSMTAPFAHAWSVRYGRIVKFDMYTDTARVLEALKAGCRSWRADTVPNYPGRCRRYCGTAGHEITLTERMEIRVQLFRLFEA